VGEAPGTAAVLGAAVLAEGGQRAGGGVGEAVGESLVGDAGEAQAESLAGGAGEAVVGVVGRGHARRWRGAPRPLATIGYGHRFPRRL